MKLREKYDEVADCLEDSENDEVRNRLKAALVVGGRIALEQVVLVSGAYASLADVKTVLEELDATAAIAPGFTSRSWGGRLLRGDGDPGRPRRRSRPG